jgi:chorismate mutase/prephenate dehydratase
MSPRKSLNDLRKDIDTVDRKLLELLSRRARLAQEIGKHKRKTSRAVLDVAREKRVLAAVTAANRGPLRDEAVESVFREVISACRSHEEPTRVAFMGPQGTFSQAAAVKQFGSSAEYDAVGSIPDVFAAVEAGRASFGVVPMENTTEGAVTPTLDALAETSTSIIAEIGVPIEHCLMSRSGDLAKVRRVVSHPQPLAQCKRWLAVHLPGVETVAASSTAAAARDATRAASTAVIGSRMAARIYGLRVAARAIQDNPANVTRFLVIGYPTHIQASGQDRTSLVVLVKDEVGVLERIIRQFSRNKVNLSMIESRPIIGRPWEYRFFIDVTGHVDEEPVARALAGLSRFALQVKVLGSYPAGG